MLKNEEWEIVNEIAAALYEHRSLESMRKAFLSRLMALIFFDLADFALAAKTDKEGLCLGEPVVVSRCFDKKKRNRVYRPLSPAVLQTGLCKLDFQPSQIRYL